VPNVLPRVATLSLVYCPEFSVFQGNDALLREKAELFSTTRDRQRKFEVLGGLTVFKDLHGHPVLRRDVGNFGIFLPPEEESSSPRFVFPSVKITYFLNLASVFWVDAGAVPSGYPNKIIIRTGYVFLLFIVVYY
jgi:hypothetical protein